MSAISLNDAWPFSAKKNQPPGAFFQSEEVQFHEVIDVDI
jgi:hypothetical protein